ncbi:MAG: hypothetical protein N2Z73_03650 [Endomicrobia bacterium]|nr:hypothetical protein [Endomicrobiia bacterium]
MIELIIVSLFLLENCFLIYLFMKERERLIRYIAMKNGVNTYNIEFDKPNLLYDSVTLDDELEAEIESRKKEKILNKIEEE